MIEVVQQINAVSRQVGQRTVEAGEARTVTISQTYDVPIDDLWDACTKPERIARWFLPVSGDFRVGGRYQIENHANGKIERCEPPKSFAATWEFDGTVSWIEVRLSSQPDGKTKFEVDHIVPVDDHWNEFGPGAVGVGWDTIVMGLATHLSSGKTVAPSEGAAWAASPEGKQFMSLSSQHWCDANVAGGANPADAGAQAGRTTAAYTTGP
jgi:uncharacterized protein YndB with AHSA1/START domain